MAEIIIVPARIRGRYPHGPAVIAEDLMRAHISNLGGSHFRLRIDDEGHPDFWMEIDMEVFTADEVPEDVHEEDS